MFFGEGLPVRGEGWRDVRRGWRPVAVEQTATRGCGTDATRGGGNGVFWRGATRDAGAVGGATLRCSDTRGVEGR